MDNQRSVRPVSAWRLFWTGVGIGFLLDAVGHTWTLYAHGIPATFTNIYTYGTRAGHAEAWALSGIVCVAYGAYVAGQAIGAILAGREELDDAIYRG